MRLATCAVLIGTTALLTAAPADAGTVAYEGQSYGVPGPPNGVPGFAYAADPGEANRVTITFTPDRIVLVDRGVAQVTAGDRCESTADPQEVECPLSRRDGDALTNVQMRVDAGDDDDTVQTVDATDGFEFAHPANLPAYVTPDQYRDATVLNGGAGDDTLTGGNGFDWVIGGGGSDTLDGGPTTDHVVGGFDVFRGPPRQNDVDGSDRLSGGGGDDLLDGGKGDDLVSGGEGNDSLSGGQDADDFRGGPGTDLVRFTGGVDSWGVNPSQRIVADIGGGADDGGPADGPEGARDNVRDDVEGLVGGEENDHLMGDSRANAIDGAQGDDVIEGGGGDDVLVGGAAASSPDPYGLTGDADQIRGDEGNDAIDGSDGTDDLDGGPGDDVVDGGSTLAGANDLIRGGDGDDRLFGGHAHSRMSGGPTPVYPDGPDQFDGGGGRDTVVTRDDVWDPEACRATGVFDAERTCNPETPQNCRPGSRVCENPADSGTCGPADDVAYVEEGDVLTECETIDPPGPVPTATAAFANGVDPVGAANASGGTSAERVVATSINSPVAGGVAIVQHPAAAQATGGRLLLPLTIETSSPATTAARPASVVFSVDAPFVPADLGNVSVLRNGAAVGECTGPAGQATPDPCVSRRSRVAGGDAALTVRSSAPGSWRLGVPVAPGDSTRPTLRFKLRGRYSLRSLIRGLRVPVTCSERCKATVELRLSRTTAKRLRLNTAVGRKSASLHNRGGVTVKLTSRAARKLRRLRRQVSMLVVAKATDGAGNKSRTVSRRIRVR